ncbi:MAG: flagellar hook-associated protein FlgK [Clostridia bacterium]|nr:flagellar hook-associated protein FlgK [Clostridia bacterium]
MRSTFFGLETALRALEAQRGAVDVAAHNVANASTPGYRRQVARLQATPPYRAIDMDGPIGAGSWGTGVAIADISSVRDAFLDRQVRAQSAWQGRYDAMDKALGEIEATLNEPSTTGLASSLDAYWKAWQAVADDPGNLAARQVLLQTAAALGEDFSHLDQQWLSIRDDVDRQIQDQVAQLNRLAQQVAELNHDIAGLKAMGQNPNDLIDQRDDLLNQMGQIAPLQTRLNADDTVDVWVQGYALVSGDRADAIDVTVGGGNLTLTWQSTGAQLTIAPGSAGSLGGLLDLREVVIPGYHAQLDAIANALASKTNSLHKAGIDLTGANGEDFFSYTGSTTGSPWTQPILLQLNPALVGHPEMIAAAAPPGASGDGTVALDIAALLDTPNVVGGAASIHEAYRGLVGQIGADRLEASTRAENAQALLQNLEVQRQSVEGVSLDEEMARLVQYQQAYQAAARTLTAIDDMIGTVVERLGRAGL